MSKLVVIGAGAAGVFGAINAKINDPKLDVIILEGGRRPLTKVKISGGGRCNVTHNCFDPKKLVENYPRGRRELLGAFHRFQPKDTIAWFADRGVETKVEADGRMFPVTNSSQTIIDCLMGELERLGIELRKGAQVKDITRSSSGFSISVARSEPVEADKILLATGSGPVGYKLAASLGHSIIDPVPSLFTFNIEDPLLEGLAGQSFQTSSLKLSFPGVKKGLEQVGPMLVTHWGLSGPAVLKLSAFGARELFTSEYQAKLRVNFINSKEGSVIDELNKMKKDNGQKHISKAAPTGLTKRFWNRFVELEGIAADTPWNQLSGKSIKALAANMTSYMFSVTGKGQFKEEFVTCGGVKLGEVDFRTMESKLVPSLYMAGEVLNIDGITGGFNFQNAWTGSWIAAQAMASE